MATGDVKKLRRYIDEARDLFLIDPVANRALIEEALGMALAFTYRSQGPYERAPRTARAMTAEIAANIVKTKSANPDWSHQKIANLYGVGVGGRVSEVIRGEWREARRQYEEIKGVT